MKYSHETGSIFAVSFVYIHPFPYNLSFLVTPLLRYHSHIQLIHLKCTIEWFLVYLQSSAAITTSYHPSTPLPSSSALSNH